MLAIAGGKGGCGKTTTTVGIGRALPGRPVVADADVDVPDLHVVAGVDPPSTLDSLADGAPLSSVATHGDGVAVVRAPRNYRSGTTARTATALATLGRTRRRVLVDCPAGAGPDAAVPVRVADAVVLVSTPVRRSVEDVAKTAAMARALETPVVGLVLTRATTVPRGLSSLVDAEILGCIPPARDAAVAASDTAGDASPRYTSSPLTDIAVQRAYRDVVSRLTHQRVMCEVW